MSVLWVVPMLVVVAGVAGLALAARRAAAEASRLIDGIAQLDEVAGRMVAAERDLGRLGSDLARVRGRARLRAGRK